MFSSINPDQVLQAALQKGGNWAEIFGEKTLSRILELDGGAISKPRAGISSGIAVRTVEGIRSINAISSQTDHDSAMGLARTVAGAVQTAPQGESKIDLRRGEDRSMVSAEIGLSDRDAAYKCELLTELEKAARAESDEVKHVRVIYRELDTDVFIANSNGIVTEDVRSYVVVVVQVVAIRDGRQQQGTVNVGLQQGLEAFSVDQMREYGKTAARQALTMLDARPAPMGQMPVVLNKGWGGVLFHEACGHGLEADGVMMGASVYANKVGEKVASDLVTAIDDATLKGEWGSYGYDDEGVNSQRTVVIENGILRGYLHSRVTADKMGVAPTGNGRRQSFEHVPIPRMTNTFIAPGQHDPKQIIAETDYGLFVKDLTGGQVNPVSGDFVFSVSEGYMIRNGKIAEPVKGASLVGNGPDILKRVDMVGSDFGIKSGNCGKMDQSVPAGCGQPTLRVSSMTVGGTEQGGKE